MKKYLLAMALLASLGMAGSVSAAAPAAQDTGDYAYTCPVRAHHYDNSCPYGDDCPYYRDGHHGRHHCGW